MILYYSDSRCKCNEQKMLQERFFTNKLVEIPRKKKRSRQGRALEYDKYVFEKTFKIKWKKNISFIEQTILNSFQSKYIYYAIDDILYLLCSTSTERNNLLLLLYSPMISLHNSYSINFFDIWINNIYINYSSENNKFLLSNQKQLSSFSYITITLLYKSSSPTRKREPLW